jgi:hypothetical protein
VPLAEPPVGTRGRPFRDLLASGFVGNSQFPGLAAVLENGRLELKLPFCKGSGVIPNEGAVRELSGRHEIEDIESLSN